MKKFSRILSVLLIAVMVVSVLGGCNKSSKQTMFTVMEEAASFEQYSYEVKMKLESDLSGMEDMTLTLFGDMDGKACTVGVKLSYLYLTINVKELFVLTEDALYVNVEKLFDSFASLLLGSSYTLVDLEEELGVELRCIKAPIIDGMIDLGSSKDEMTKLGTDILEAALEGVKISDSKGVYTASIEDVKQFAEFVDNYITAVLDNKDKLMSVIRSNVGNNTDKMTDMVELYVDEVMTAVEKFSSEYNLGLTSEQLTSAKEEALKQLEDEMADLDLDDMDSMYEEMFDELASEQKDLVKSIKDSDAKVNVEIKNEITGKKGERTYNCELKMNLEGDGDEVNLQVMMEMNEQKDLSVKVPKQYTSVSDLIYGILVFAYENDMIDPDDLLVGSGDISLPVNPTEPTSPVNPTEPATQEQPSVSSGTDTIRIGSGEWLVDLEYDDDLLMVKDDTDAESGSVIFAPVNGRNVDIELIFAPKYTVQEAIDTILSEVKDYITGSELVDTFNVDGNTARTYKYVVADTTETLEVWFYTLELSDSDAIMLAYAFGDDLQSVKVDPEDIGEAVFDGIVDLSTGSSVGGSGSSQGPEDTYGGSIVLEDSWENTSVTIEYDAELVYPDPEYSSPEYGSVCFNAVKDEFCYIFVSYEGDYDLDDFYEDQQEWYGSYDSMRISKITSRKIGTLTVNEFTLKYKSSYSDSDIEMMFFAVEAGDGLLYGYIDDTDFDENSVLSYDEMLQAVFKKIK